MGVPARSWLGWQLPIRTEEAHARARILEIETGALAAAMGRGEVAVIPGFQGMMDDGRVATLGRGGSDTSEAAVAAGGERAGGRRVGGGGADAEGSRWLA